MVAAALVASRIGRRKSTPSMTSAQAMSPEFHGQTLVGSHPPRRQEIFQADAPEHFRTHAISDPIDDLRAVPGRILFGNRRQNARTVCTIGTQPVIPAVYGVKAPL